MLQLKCDRVYEQHLKEYNDRILKWYGVASQSAEREIIYMADSGNTVALKLYGDMVFYQKILRKHYYRDAFSLYLRAAGITVKEDGQWESDGAAYPLAFWWIGYYLVNYKQESYLQKCETIDVIESLSEETRVLYAFILASACLVYEKVPGAINLLGRILQELSESQELYERLHTEIDRVLREYDYSGLSVTIGECTSASDYAEIAEQFFLAAAKAGYIYACNNLAAREAERIVTGMKGNAGDGKSGTVGTYDAPAQESFEENIRKYIDFLTIAADRYEPYAANRLGLFYRTGEIISTTGTYVCKGYTDTRLAKEYFLKATVYPDANSAWAYLNLMKYYHKDYDTNIELMNEHMDYIKALNSKVYDIAMEL